MWCSSQEMVIWSTELIIYLLSIKMRTDKATKYFGCKFRFHPIWQSLRDQSHNAVTSRIQATGLCFSRQKRSSIMWLSHVFREYTLVRLLAHWSDYHIKFLKIMQEPQLADEEMLLPKIRVGICAMDKKAQSKPMNAIVERMLAFGEFEIFTFGDNTILEKPVSEWPQCECLLSWHSDGFPLAKVSIQISWILSTLMFGWHNLWKIDRKICWGSCCALCTASRVPL